MWQIITKEPMYKRYTIIRKRETCLQDKFEGNLFNSNAPVSASAIHNGLECVKAKMKLNVLQDSRHTDEEKEKRMRQIDIDIHHTEEVMKNGLEF